MCRAVRVVRDRRLARSAHPIATRVVDPIGAGDAFNAGYIAVRLRGELHREALQAGVRCGAAVTRR